MYEPPQKKNSSWTPSTVQKKGKSPSKLGHFSIQPKPNPSSESSQEIGEYSRTSMDRLAANVMRSLQTREQEIAEESIQPKFESPWAPTFEPPPPLPESPASKLKGAFAPVSKNPIQRQCAECAKEEEEQKGEERKDVEEIGIQTKLTVGAPGDSYEQEADRMASQVMSMSAPSDSSESVQRQLDTNHPHHPHQIWKRAQSIKPVMQRQIDPRVQMREMIQRAHQIDGNQASGDLESRLNASKGGGSPLSENVIRFMEPRFGADFSGVRVHTGGEAVQMNQELGAQAFTHGSDVYFGAGKEPGNNELTAHELTHVVQQSETTTRSVQRWGSPEHMELGDTTGIKIDIGGGFELTFGQVVALAGDEFASLEQLRAATETDEGRKMIRAHLERAGIPGEAAALLPAPTPENREQATTEYITLALDNSSHFAGGGTAVENWLSHHAQAIDSAIQAGLSNDESLMNQAYMTEAFGNHFLTDAFSSGHIRVPRQEITDYYTNEFAPLVFDHLLNHLRDRLIDEIYDQVDEQTILDEAAWVVGGIGGGLSVEAGIRHKIRTAINGKLNQAFQAAGGRQVVIQKLGLGLAGIIAGAMHDMENRDGLLVVSNVDGIPWEAYGDENLDKNPQHKAHVEEAVRTSVADLERAYEIAREEGQNLFNLIDSDSLPAAIYFGFDSDNFTASAAAQVDMVADYLQYNSATNLTLTGHADPSGGDAYNDDLSSRRAERVANRLLSLGVDPSRISVEVQGEKQPVTTDVAQYYRNRRVEFTYMTNADAETSQEPNDVAYENVLSMVGPPYAAEDHLPRAAEGLNEDLPEWRWGSIPQSFQQEMANWIKHYINEYSATALESPALEPIEESGFTIEPRPVAREIVNEILNDPIQFLSQALGRSAGS